MKNTTYFNLKKNHTNFNLNKSSSYSFKEDYNSHAFLNKRLKNTNQNYSSVFNKNNLKLKNYTNKTLNKSNFNDYYIIGQFDKKFFILKSNKNQDILILDQHAIHERILFEALKFRFKLTLREFLLKSNENVYKNLKNNNSFLIEEKELINQEMYIHNNENIMKNVSIYSFLHKKVFSKHVLNNIIELDIEKINLEFDFYSMTNCTNNSEYNNVISMLNFDFIIDLKINKIKILAVPIVFDNIMNNEEAIEIFLNIFYFFIDIFKPVKRKSNNIHEIQATKATDINNNLINKKNSLFYISDINFLVDTIFIRQIKYKSCRNAIRFGDVLNSVFMEEIFSHLKNCENPFICAHGRHNFFILNKK